MPRLIRVLLGRGPRLRTVSDSAGVADAVSAVFTPGTDEFYVNLVLAPTSLFAVDAVLLRPYHDSVAVTPGEAAPIAADDLGPYLTK